jgi:putative ABC transport system substrate-binding protein
MRDLGYVEGRNVRIEHRRARGQIELLPQVANELVANHVESSRAAVVTARVARDATSTVPIVVAFHDYDPVAAGLIARFSRPGGNFTGVFARQSDLAGKRIELLRETLPRVSRLAVLSDASSGDVSRAEISRVQHEPSVRLR